MTELVTNVI